MILMVIGNPFANTMVASPGFIISL